MSSEAWAVPSSDFVRAHCRVSEDVAYEARYTARVASLDSITEPITPAILARLTEVMRSVPPDDKTLVDLYNNKGAADPVLVATALVLNELESPYLLPDEWVIVTHDKAVRTKAEEFFIGTRTPEELANVIDLSTG